MNELFTFGSTESGEGAVALDCIGSSAELVEDNVVLLLAATLKGDGVDASPDVRMDGTPVAGSELGEHFLRGFDYFGIARRTSTPEKEGFELRLNMVLILAEGPTFRMGLCANEVTLEGFERVTNLIRC